MSIEMDASAGPGWSDGGLERTWGKRVDGSGGVDDGWTEAGWGGVVGVEAQFWRGRRGRVVGEVVVGGRRGQLVRAGRGQGLAVHVVNGAHVHEKSDEETMVVEQEEEEEERRRERTRRLAAACNDGHRRPGPGWLFRDVTWRDT